MEPGTATYSRRAPTSGLRKVKGKHGEEQKLLPARLVTLAADQGGKKTTTTTGRLGSCIHMA